jgi:hypothetical protein
VSTLYYVYSALNLPVIRIVIITRGSCVYVCYVYSALNQPVIRIVIITCGSCVYACIDVYLNVYIYVYTFKLEDT